MQVQIVGSMTISGPNLNAGCFPSLSHWGLSAIPNLQEISSEMRTEIQRGGRAELDSRPFQIQCPLHYSSQLDVQGHLAKRTLEELQSGGEALGS